MSSHYAFPLGSVDALSLPVDTHASLHSSSYAASATQADDPTPNCSQSVAAFTHHVLCRFYQTDAQ